MTMDKEIKEGFVVKGLTAPPDMEKINRYTRRGYNPEEVYSFSLVLCDNEVDRDFECFSQSALEKLALLFVGKTCIFDHERKSANQTARIYDTWLEREEKTTQSGEPYVTLRAKAYLPRTEKTRDVIELIESGILKEVSISCSVVQTVCSICGENRCAHQKGKTYGGVLCCRVLRDPSDAYECSFVAVPAQRAAGVTKSFEKGGKRMDVKKKLEEGAVTLSEEESKALVKELFTLEEKAHWGEEYQERLSGEILKYSALLQPELPSAVMKSALSNLSLRELLIMGKTYEKMAQRILPLKPQLAPEKSPVRKDENEGFTI